MQNDPSTTVHKTLILGSGPSGYTAAIYAARADLQPVLIAGPQPGGQLTTTTEVENYPGFPHGKTGPELMDAFREQAERFGTEIHHELGVEVDLSQRPFTVRTDQGKVFRAETLIVSTGASAGDCQDSFYRQAVTAAGSGCMAAIEVERWLEEHGSHESAADLATTSTAVD